MNKFFIKSNISTPYHIWQGVFLILLFSSVTTVFSKPAVGLLFGNNGHNDIITFVGIAVEGFKSGIIECEYDASIDIDQALLGSAISAIALGASIDRSNHRLRITISATRQLAIDSVSIITLEIPLSGTPPLSVLKILSASFTNQNGATQTADIRPSLKVGISYHPFRNRKEYTKPDQFFQFNGRTISQNTMHNYKLGAASRLLISQRIVSKIK